MDQQHGLLSSSPNSHTALYNSADTMATSLSGMTVNDHIHGNQYHKENGVAVGLVRPGDCPMKESSQDSAEEQKEEELAVMEGSSAGETVATALAAGFSSDGNDKEDTDRFCEDERTVLEQEEELLTGSWTRRHVSPERTRSLSLESDTPSTFLVRTSALEDLTCVDGRIIEQRESRAPYCETLHEEVSFSWDGSEDVEALLPEWTRRPQPAKTNNFTKPQEPAEELRVEKENSDQHMEQLMNNVGGNVNVRSAKLTASIHETEPRIHCCSSPADAPQALHSSPGRKSLVPVAQNKAQSKTNGDVEKRAPSSTRPHAAGTKIPAMTSVTKNGKDSSMTPETSGQNSPGTPKSPGSKAVTGKTPTSTGNEIKKVAVIRSTPKSPKNRSPTSLSAAAPLPDLKSVRSKVGSTDNMKHQPGGGRIQILDQKVDFSNVQSKCGSKSNMRHVPGGGNVRILDQKVDFSTVSSRCGSKDNIKHSPGGGNVKILDQKVDFSTVQSKCGSKINLKHAPGGGNVRILDQKVDFSSVQSKCGSKDNLKHVPGGGSVKILDQKVDFSTIQSKCGSKDNLKHAPGGGNIQILNKKIDLTNVQSKCGSKDNIRHKPGGGNIEIRSEKLDFKAQSKVGSLDNIKHVAGGGTRRREKERGSVTPQDEGFLTPDPSDTPTLSSASLSPEPVLLSNPQITVEDSY